jgi:hypothetical protein
MLPQPPTDVPAPPPSEDVLRSGRSWRIIWIAVAVSVLFFSLLVVTVLRSIESHKKPNQIEAVNNARVIGILLLDFQEEYGKFPDSTTIAAVQSKIGSHHSFGTTTSNDFFRQLFASDMIQFEDIFYANIDGARKPDGLMDGSHLLEKGECGFTYFLGATKSDNPKRPLVATPRIPGSNRFDPKRFNGKAVILRMDNSTILLEIDKDGHAILDGQNLMDPHHPIWDSHAPEIAWPDI